MIDYEVGAIPSRPLTIAVRDEGDNSVNTIGYDSIRVEMIDTDDKAVDMSAVTLLEVPDTVGVFSLFWPKTSIFNKKGIYVLRLVMETSDGSKDITRTAEIRVREYGRIK